MEYKTMGFPHIITGPIKRLPIGELLLQPFMRSVPLEEARRNGTEYQNYILDQVPFSFTKKHILVNFSVQLLTPDLSPVKNVQRADREWHVDGGDTYNYDEYRYHIMISPCEATTEFNAAPFTVDVPKPTEMIALINQEGNDIRNMIVSKEIEPYHIVTFDNTHIHRAKKPSKPEFRLFFRAVETDDEHELHGFGDRYGASYVFPEFSMPKYSIQQNLRAGAVESFTLHF